MKKDDGNEKGREKEQGGSAKEAESSSSYIWHRPSESHVDSTRTNRSRFSLVEFGLRLFRSTIGKWCIRFAMRMTPRRVRRGKGLFLDSRVKKPGGRSRASGGEKRGLSDY